MYFFKYGSKNKSEWHTQLCQMRTNSHIKKTRMTHPYGVAENWTTRPLPRVQTLMTHPLSAPAHPPPPSTFWPVPNWKQCSFLNRSFWERVARLRCCEIVFLFQNVDKVEVRSCIESNQNPENFVSATLKKITEVLVKPALKKTASQFAHFFSSSPFAIRVNLLHPPPSLFRYGIYNVWMQETTQRIIKLLGLYCRISWSRNACTRRHSKCYKTKLIARLVLRQKGKIYWPIFQLAELAFFSART